MMLVPAIGQTALLVGVDLTLQPFDDSAIATSVMRWIDQNAGDGESVEVIAVTSKTVTTPKVLAEAVFPPSPGIMGTDRTKTLDVLKSTLQQHLKERSSYGPQMFQYSRIADFFVYAATAYPPNGSREKVRRMALWSDMLEVHEGVNWETGPVAAEHIKIPRLWGSIEIRGVQSTKYKNSEMWERVRDIWMRAISDAGVKVRSYSSTY
jgi:hypothetical protein